MNSSISDGIESAMLKLYEILAQRSDVELPPNYSKDPSEQTSVIIYERYLPDNNTLFLYAYDSTTFIIFKQYHLEVDQITTNLQQYYIILQNFLKELLASNVQLCIYFLNFGTYLVTDLEQKLEEAIKLLNQNLATNKIILCMDQQEIPNLSQSFLVQKISSTQLALLKFEHNRITELEKYKIFTLDKIFEIQQIHLNFLEIQQKNEQYIGMFNIFTLIKDITQQENLTNSTEYLAQFLFNLPKYTQQGTLSVIQKLKVYLNKIQYKTKQKQKLKTQELQSLFDSKLALFKDEKNWHFPKKGANSQKCKVCQKHSKDEQKKIRKSSYVCHSCQKYYKINITLCTINCFKLFHLNPGFYMGRVKKKSIKKVTKVEE